MRSISNGGCGSYVAGWFARRTNHRDVDQSLLRNRAKRLLLQYAHAGIIYLYSVLIYTYSYIATDVYNMIILYNTHDYIHAVAVVVASDKWVGGERESDFCTVERLLLLLLFHCAWSVFARALWRYLPRFHLPTHTHTHTHTHTLE